MAMVMVMVMDGSGDEGAYHFVLVVITHFEPAYHFSSVQFGAYISYIRSSHTKKKFVVKIILIWTLIAVKVRTI